MNMAEPSELQLDALREVANIGCAQGVSALSRLVGGRKMVIDLPRVLVAGVGKMASLVGGDELPAVTAEFALHGQLTGRLLLVLPEADANKLKTLLLEHARATPIAAHAESALQEAANIVASACVSAISTLTGLRLLPSTPTLSTGKSGELVAAVLAASGAPAGLVVALEARFQTEVAPALCGRLLVLPDREALPTLLAALGV